MPCRRALPRVEPWTPRRSKPAAHAGRSATTPRARRDATSPRCPASRSSRSTGRPRPDDADSSGSAGRGSTRSPAACTPTGYRGKPWTIRQFAGFGNAQQTNERYKMILAEGGGGLSVAFDMPTLMGRDSDDPRSLGEVGHCGVAIDSAADMDVLFDGIDLGVDHDVDDDQRARRARVLHVRRRRRAAGRRPGEAQRHAADRHLQGVHRAEGVALSRPSRTCG